MDASGGTARCSYIFDVRYTTLCGYINLTVAGAAAGAAFDIQVFDDVANVAFAQICGTAPFIAATVATNNTAFLWFPPALFMKQNGVVQITVPNVDGDTLGTAIELFEFDAEIRQLMPIQTLMWTVPGISAPAAI